ncbi:G-type lectin S-receptor-like serine/threonine-protein kinase RLK1 [Pistacia vera]|uniref:G-type lectin S-receptor-like serine/threonine-protein kinase RLK1 n=1 Tax=Pistacia vera TaxID=55513 RepID=UPI0012639EC1|nr:G-type lectin S-receptor-like serine/threonine-protein kinase RLK1 [Pistacia vera]
MAAILFFFLMLSANFLATTQQGHFNKSLGSSLTPTRNSSWLSPSGFYGFGFYQQGNGFCVGIFIAGIPQKTVVWKVNRDSPPVPTNVTLLLTGGGRLILQSAEGEETSIVNTPKPVAKASMLDSGNFILYNSDEEIIWQSFRNPTNIVLPGQGLLAGEELYSSVSETDQSTGIFRLKMQHDGNLVQYPKDTPDSSAYAYYSSFTYGRGDNVSLNLDYDGHLYLLNSTGFTIKNLVPGGYSTEETIYLMKVDADGIFRLYSFTTNQSNMSVVWASSDDKCSPKGRCGLNRYCVKNDGDIYCQCLPGFAVSGERGCQQNFSTENCESKNGNIKYTIERVANTTWEDTSYSILSLPTNEECEKACLEDCICEAAMFGDGKCRKQKLPLRFGIKLESESNLALIKVGVSNFAGAPREGDEPKGGKKESHIVNVSLLVVAFIILIISGVLVYRNRVHGCKRISNKIRLDEDFGLKSFTYLELLNVTNNFTEEIGRGAFGTVFRGEISHNQKVIAVKRLDRVSTEGEKEFQTEMTAIGKTHHRNLVRLLGYYHEGPNRLLVYEYMSNGSLADLLFTLEKQPCWDQRMDIACNIAKGLLYLHEDCETRIIHCDIKPQNILIDEHNCAKISDFGLAKLLKPDQTRSLTRIKGTRGYVAPEWHRKLPVIVKADVYSFEIVLLEIICYRRCVDWTLPEEEAILEEWVYNCFQAGELGKVVGGEEVDKLQLERMVKVGLWCIQYEPSLCASMKTIVLMLEGIIDIPFPPNPTFFFLVPFVMFLFAVL